MPWLNAERTAVLLFFYCLRCLWLSLAQWLFEDSLKTNVSQQPRQWWFADHGRKWNKKKLLMRQMPASNWTSYFCTGVSRSERKLVWGQHLLAFASAYPCPHTDTKYTRPSSASVSAGTGSLCHWAFRPVFKPLGASRPRPLALNCEHGKVEQWLNTCTACRHSGRH